MTGAGIIWQVAHREITERGRSKAYLVTTGVTLLIVVGLIVVPTFFGGGPDKYPVGSVGAGNEAIIDSAGLLGNAGLEPGQDPKVVFTVTSFDRVEEAKAALETGDIEAVLVDASEVIVKSASGFGGSPLVGLLQRGASSVELEALVSEKGQAAADVIAVMTSDPLTTTTLSGPKPGKENAGVVAYAGLMLLYIAILLYGTWILSGVTEEKSNRVVEVLISSVKPWQLLAGKIAGIGVLGIAQFSGTIMVALVAVKYTKTFDLPSIGPTSVANLIIWFILGFLIYAMLFGAAGSLVSRMEDAQNVAFPMTMIAVAGFFVSIVALDDPDGLAATVGTFVPLTAPFVVPVRAAFDAIPLWQFAASVILVMLTIAGLTLVAGRIYAGALLRFGGRTKLREAWHSAAE